MQAPMRARPGRRRPRSKKERLYQTLRREILTLALAPVRMLVEGEVVITGRRAELGQRLENEIRERGARCLFIETDHCQADHCSRVVERTLAEMTQLIVIGYETGHHAKIMTARRSGDGPRARMTVMDHILLTQDRVLKCEASGGPGGATGR